MNENESYWIRRWPLAAAIFAVSVASLWFLFGRGQDSAAAEVLRSQGAFQNRLTRAFNTIPPAIRDPLRAVKHRLIGAPQLVGIDVVIVRFTNAPAIQGATGLPVQGQNVSRLRFDRVPGATTQDIVRELRDAGNGIIGSHSTVAFSGHALQVATVANPASNIYDGVTVDVLPRARNNTVSVALHIEELSPLSAEAPGFPTVTNALVSARITLESRDGVLITPESGLPSIGVFVRPRIIPRPK